MSARMNHVGGEGSARSGDRTPERLLRGFEGMNAEVFLIVGEKLNRHGPGFGADDEFEKSVLTVAGVHRLARMDARDALDVDTHAAVIVEGHHCNRFLPGILHIVSRLIQARAHRVYPAAASG